MKLGNLDTTSISADWNKRWSDIFDHYQNDLRHAHYIRALLEADERHILEIGAGSFRDMAELRRCGLDCEGMDFSEKAVSLAKKHFPDYAKKIHCMSAFQMEFPDDGFDVSYHNGFWVLFPDEQIDLLAQEQARITRSRMIATVHNAHNKDFFEYFERKKLDDPLYDIRFFEVEEVSELMRKVCRDVHVVPAGKGKRYHEDLLIKHGVTDPKAIRDSLSSYGMEFLGSSERLICIGTVI